MLNSLRSVKRGAPELSLETLMTTESEVPSSRCTIASEVTLGTLRMSETVRNKSLDVAFFSVKQICKGLIGIMIADINRAVMAGPAGSLLSSSCLNAFPPHLPPWILISQVGKLVNRTQVACPVVHI